MGKNKKSTTDKSKKTETTAENIGNDTERLKKLQAEIKEIKNQHKFLTFYKTLRADSNRIRSEGGSNNDMKIKLMQVCEGIAENIDKSLRDTDPDYDSDYPDDEDPDDE